MRAETSEKVAAQIVAKLRALFTKPHRWMESRTVDGGTRIFCLYLLTRRGSLYWIQCIRQCVDTNQTLLA